MIPWPGASLLSRDVSLIRRFQHHIKSLYHFKIFIGPCQVYIQCIGVEKCRSTVRKRSPSPPNRSLLCDRLIRIVLSPDWSIRRIPSFGHALSAQVFIVYPEKSTGRWGRRGRPGRAPQYPGNNGGRTSTRSTNRRREAHLPGRRHARRPMKPRRRA